MRLVCGLGNPGAAYAGTRHNVAWWLLEAARVRWSFPPFQRTGVSVSSAGTVADHDVVLLAPLTYVNRSGTALGPWLETQTFVPERDLLVVVDDVALDVGRVRIRASGSSGGHNGLKSVEAALSAQAYARLRIGVGTPPPEVDLADWVLSPLPKADEDRVRDLLPDLVDALVTWVTDGADVAARKHNR